MFKRIGCCIFYFVGDVICFWVRVLLLIVLGSLIDWIFGFYIYKIVICNRSVGRIKVIVVMYMMCIV